MKAYKEKDLEELLEELPNNLHLARDSNAPRHDKYRMYNKATGKYLESTGSDTAKGFIIYMIEEQNKSLEQWKT